MKIVGKDNYDRENVADELWLDNLPNEPEFRPTLVKICDRLNRDLFQYPDGPGTYYMLLDDDYVLWRGMEELV